MIPSWQLTHGVGLGDFFNLDSFLSPEKRAALELVYQPAGNGPGSDMLASLMAATPSYRHVKHRSLRYLTEQPPGTILTMRDHSITHKQCFHGSVFLAEDLDCVVPEGLPEGYVVIVPSTPKNGPRCTRFLTDAEWPFVLTRLESLGVAGVILNMPGGRSNLPDHPSLIDWTGRTSLPQAIEILKRSRGYIGVDSNLAILAAELFEAPDLWIRTNNSYLIDYPFWTYPPHWNDFSFLYPRFDQPAYPPTRPPLPPGKLVALKVNALVGTRNYCGGDRVDMPLGARLESMLDHRHALPVDLAEYES